MEARSDRLACRHCGTEGRMDEYGFISGFPVDTPAAWDRFQRQSDSRLRDAEFSSGATLFVNDYRSLRQRAMGRVKASYHGGKLYLEGAVDLSFDVAAMTEVVMTMRSDLHFSAAGSDWVLRLDSLSIPFLRACQDRY
jgi:hypothetical protein